MDFVLYKFERPNLKLFYLLKNTGREKLIPLLVFKFMSFPYFGYIKPH